MITQINNKLHRLTKRQGQHIAEFMVLFLAVCIAFVGTRLYLRRGINAKLKLMEDRVNEAIVPIGSAATSSFAVSIDVWNQAGDHLPGCGGEFPVKEEYLESMQTSGNWFCIPCFISQCNPSCAPGILHGRIYYNGETIVDKNFEYSSSQVAKCAAYNYCRP